LHPGPTAAKTRLLAESNSNQQHVARLDYPAPEPSSEARTSLRERLQGVAGLADAIVVSDYKGGVVGADLVDQIGTIGKQRGIPVCVDSQGDLSLYRGLHLVKCNQLEAEATLGARLDSEAAIERAGTEILTRLDLHRFVLTRGADGLSVFERDRPPVHLPAANRTEVFDVAGAGDTVIAIVTLALVAGASLVQAAQLANAAAGLVVRRLGVVTVSPAELIAALGSVET